jgi:sec-independent protein translocase protein TatC
MTDINRYLDFVLKLFFAFGIAFEIPIAALLLIWAGITTRTPWREAPLHHRRLLRLRHAAHAPDVISQSLLALPMWLLFEAGVFFGRVLLKRRDDETEE